MEKPFYKIIAVFLCKKTARKNTKYSRNETIWKIGHLGMADDMETSLGLPTVSYTHLTLPTKA